MALAVVEDSLPFSEETIFLRFVNERGVLKHPSLRVLRDEKDCVVCKADVGISLSARVWAGFAP